MDSLNLHSINLSHEAFRANAEMYMQKIRIQGSKKVDKMNSSNPACDPRGGLYNQLYGEYNGKAVTGKIKVK